MFVCFFYFLSWRRCCHFASHRTHGGIAINMPLFLWSVHMCINTGFTCSVTVWITQCKCFCVCTREREPCVLFSLLCLCLYAIQLVSFMQWSWLCIYRHAQIFLLLIPHSSSVQFFLRQSICVRINAYLCTFVSERARKIIELHMYTYICPLFVYDFIWFIRATMHTLGKDDAMIGRASPCYTLPSLLLFLHSIFRFISFHSRDNMFAVLCLFVCQKRNKSPR